MAVREIRVLGDEVLGKMCKPVTEITQRTVTLIEDMLDTMYEAGGVGLAAPQIGILKRIVVIDVGDGPIIMINPEIIETWGEQVGDEGCLSIPGESAIIKRPLKVKVGFMDGNLEMVEMIGEELLARAFCHEIDHLDGKLYTRLA